MTKLKVKPIVKLIEGSEEDWRQTDIQTHDQIDGQIGQ